MNDKPPSIQEWRDLYNAVIEFKKIECWNWMWDSDLFGVQNPVTGEIGYCCVMGGAGELFALTVYLDSEGLDGYLKMQSEEFYPSPEEMLNLQKCLMASFEDRKYLQKEDSDLLTSPYKENHYFVRVSKKDKTTGGLSWEDRWLKPLPLEKGEIIAEPIDTVRLEAIKRRISHRQGVWEIDFFYFPQVIKEKEGRPFYPYVTLWVEHNSGFILHYHLAKLAECISEFQGQFLKIAEDIKSLPQEILFKKEETFKLLKPIASELGIKLIKVKRLRMLEDAQESMSKFTAGENRDEI
jgi:hypothetical protein